MVTLEDRLDSLGLGRYFTVLCENGFDDWDTVLDITEDDLRELGFKLGHRRTLQREIANYRGSATQEGCQSPTVANPSGIMSPITEHSTSNAEMLLSKRKKRRYRWHARPDPNAPKRPKTAYVNFADHLRTDPAIANMSFVEIAKEVGKQWQVMDTGIKQHWETQAAAAMQGYEEQMEAYRRTEKYQQYQEYMENFKKAPGKTTRQKLKTNSSSETVPRSGRSESADSGEGGGPASQDSNGESPERLHDECQRALFKASTELKRLRHEYSDIQPEDTLAMPPDDLARTAIGAMMEGSGSLLYVFSKEQAEKLLADAYDASSKPDSLLLTELCIASAVGGHYNPRAISSSLTKRLAATALAFLESVDATGDEHYLRIMRIMCCFAMHALLEKHVSARCCVTAALVIARWKYPQLSASGDNTASRESWRKVYRTVVFLDCWMCYTLGYASENAHVHLKYALEAAAPQDSIENAIQHQATKLAVIAAEISHAVQQSDRISRACVDYLIAKLDSWQHELPVPFQLISLMSTGPLPPESERALLMVHVLYLGAVILLHRQLLVAADTDRHAGQWTLAIDEKEIERYQASCEMAAQRVAQLLSMVKLDGYCTLWNWLVTYWCFSAGVVLLYRVAQNLRDGKLVSVDDYLACSKTCMQMLQVCSNEEPVAVRYLAMLEPAFETLQTIRRRLDAEVERGKRSSQPKISISALLEPTESPTPTTPPQDLQNTGLQPPKVDPILREDAAKIVARMGVIMKNPFGKLHHTTENGVMENPYPTPPLSETVFWFR